MACLHLATTMTINPYYNPNKKIKKEPNSEWQVFCDTENTEITEIEYKRENMENYRKQCFCNSKENEVENNWFYIEYFKVTLLLKISDLWKTAPPKLV